jgi:hypothetical protein
MAMSGNYCDVQDVFLAWTSPEDAPEELTQAHADHLLTAKRAVILQPGHAYGVLPLEGLLEVMGDVGRTWGRWQHEPDDKLRATFQQLEQMKGAVRRLRFRGMDFRGMDLRGLVFLDSDNKVCWLTAALALHHHVIDESHIYMYTHLFELAPSEKV